MTLATVASVVGIAGGVSSLMGGSSGGGSTQPGQASVADPFAGQRPQYQQQLQNLMTNPGSMTSSPMYQFAFNQGMEGVNRGMARSGELGGGARMTGLSDFGQGQASQQFTGLESMLANLAGASSGNPGMAGQLGQQQNQANWQGIGQGLNQLGGMGAFGDGGGGSYTGGTPDTSMGGTTSSLGSGFYSNPYTSF